METIADIPISFIRWENLEKKRYYQIYISRDLFGDWVITKSWGSLITAAGRITRVACFSTQEVLNLIEKIKRTRLKRGYLPC